MLNKALSTRKSQIINFLTTVDYNNVELNPPFCKKQQEDKGFKISLPLSPYPEHDPKKVYIFVSWKFSWQCIVVLFDITVIF